MVNEVTFVGFRGGYRPNPLPWIRLRFSPTIRRYRQSLLLIVRFFAKVYSTFIIFVCSRR